MKKLSYALICLLITGSMVSAPAADKPERPPSISKKTAGMKKYEGFMTFYWDEIEGKIYLEIDKWDEDLLYLYYLARGIGSNDIGLDRGQLGGTHLIRFRRIGPRVLMIEPNYSYRAISENEAERRAVKESFAESVIRGWEVAAEEGDRVIVDATKFFFRDAHDVSGALKNSKQGSFKVDSDRTAFHLPGTKNFPDNTEVEVIQTFMGDSPGRYLRQIVPSPKSVTVHLHHSFVRLPDDGYNVRKFDPRAGFFGISYMDYATAIDEPIRKRFIARHRLVKKNPGEFLSEPVEPIVYYVDRGAPEPVRSALVDGASWWNEAFEAAGFKDAFQVKVLPDDADPLDVRYNVIQWVHRSTRGWSYGASVRDPRTGEIIKGHISLGSLRVRQDFLIAEGLLAPYTDEGKMPEEMQRMALARIKQLSAHEVGHTLGLAHNFAASASDRASVMDYPHPLIRFNEGGLPDLYNAYDEGIGEWDKVVIKYGYTQFDKKTDEDAALGNILKESMERHLIFISDADARPAGGAHPIAHLWDNGPNTLKEFDKVMKVRRIALDRFSENNIRIGAPMATLEEVLVPVYMFHRYQTEASAKVLGGLYYTYALKGDGQTVTEIVAPEVQRKALEALLTAMNPEELTLPRRILRLIPPRPFGYGRTRESFPSRTGVTFDPLSAAESAALIPVRLLLNHNRAGRLVEYHARDPRYPGLGEVIDRLMESTWKSKRDEPYIQETGRVVDNLVLRQLMLLAGNEAAAPQVRSTALLKIDELGSWLGKRHKKEKDAGQRAHYFSAYSMIERFRDDPGSFVAFDPVEPPPGSPIGFECAGTYGFSW